FIMQKSAVRILVFAFTIATLMSPGAFSQEVSLWKKAAATKEINGLRRYGWALADGIGKTLENAPSDTFPAVNVFMRDFRTAFADVDPDVTPEKWKLIDVETQVIHNPNYWAAVYEIAPADPLLMWFHASLYAVNGQVHRAFYAQQLALHSPVDTPFRKEMGRLLISAGRVISIGEMGIQNGIKLHDLQKYDQAVAVYRDVLSVVPSHSLALYELGYCLDTVAREKEGRGQNVSAPFFADARRFDPFMIESYQGNFSADEYQRLITLKTRAKPTWDKFSQTSPDQDNMNELKLLSSHFQDAALHDLALIVRQLVVAHRDGSYSDDDRRFIETSLKSLVPKGDTAATVSKLGRGRKELRIKNITGVE
ncbi:MAG: hypothetical protein GY826_13070, partial [Fuerstiella sp.]|nr:hypothetical protein [Fuerstiella sp.]